MKESWEAMFTEFQIMELNFVSKIKVVQQFLFFSSIEMKYDTNVFLSIQPFTVYFKRLNRVFELVLS